MDLPALGIGLMYSYNSYQWHVVDSVLKVPVVGEGEIKMPSLSRDNKGVYHALWVTINNGKEGLVHATTSDFREWSAPEFIQVGADDTSMPRISSPRMLFDMYSDTCMVYWGLEKKDSSVVAFLKTTDFIRFTPIKTLYKPGFSMQHPCIYRLNDRDYVLLITDAQPVESNLKVAYGHSMEGPFADLSRSLSAYQTRNASVTKIGAKWYIFYENCEKKLIETVSTLDFGSFEAITEETSIPYLPASGDIVVIPRKPFRKLMKHLLCKPVKEPK